MKYSIIFFGFLLLSGCASRYQIERHHNSLLRRMPQMNRVETGRPMDQGSFSAAVSTSYSLQSPNVMQISDSNFESRSTLLGDEFTIITSSNAFCYESRLMISGEGLYAFTNVISAGVSLDASLGRLQGTIAHQGKTIFNDNIEGALILKFAKQYGKLAVSIRPELILNHLYGDRAWTETDSGTGLHTATERLSYYTLSIRSCSAIRYDIFKNLTPFFGLHIKSQQYPKADDEIDNEVAYGIYGGVDFHYRLFATSPYITIPLGSTTSHFKSPISAGLQISMILRSE